MFCEYQQPTNSVILLCSGGGVCTMCVKGNGDKYMKIYNDKHPIYNISKKESKQ